jgi:chromate transporter
MALHIGLRRAGRAGLLAAGACFILPAAIAVYVCAWAYVRYGSLPQTEALLYAVKPVIISIVARAIFGLARAGVKSGFLALAGVASLVLALRGADVLLLLFGAGAVAGTVDWISGPRAGEVRFSRVLRMIGFAALMVVVPDALTRFRAGTANAPAAYGLLPLSGFFLKVGLTLYGGGYVLIAFLRDELVRQWHWLTESQLLDAIAVGQMTPGPLFTTATFIGYLVGGLTGAVAATLAIFLPSFVLVGLSGPLIPRLRRSRLAGAFLDGVNVAALALMAAVTLQLGAAALVDVYTVSIAIVSAVILFRYRLNSAWLILGAAVAGIAKYGFT